MSLVGPRPILLDEYDKYGEGIARYQQSVPGMTGMWQVCGRDELDYEQRIRLNNWYHAHATLWTELAIMLRTAVVVLRRLGAS
jgi:lipopolysaccharide/colanic/teichoic acid biosynthesis glycosyltransferase